MDRETDGVGLRALINGKTETPVSHPGAGLSTRGKGMVSSECSNRRILVIDDNVSIHEDFRKILGQHLDASLLGRIHSGLFDDAPTPGIQVSCFDLECADQGHVGFRMVQEAVQKGRPYAVAFVDMRHASWLGWY